MNNSRITTILAGAFAVAVLALLSLQLLIMRQHGSDVRAAIADSQRDARYEYSVFSIEDNEWDTRAVALGEAGWEIISARRAQTGDGVFAYECIVKRKARD